MSATASKSISWREASSSAPCLICEGKKWCRIVEDKSIVCCRNRDSHPTWGRGKPKEDKDGILYYVFHLTWKSAGEQWEAPRYSLADGKGELADPDTLNRVYSELLAALSLTSDHVRALWARGYDERPSVLMKYGYRTLAGKRRRIAYKLVQAGLEPHLPRVPGFYVAEGREGSKCWTVGGPSGLLFPVRDATGRIVGLLVRRDDGRDGGKYGWASSKRKGGASPGNPIHVPQFDGDKAIVRVTEGALKANVATRLSGILTLGLPGLSGRGVVNVLKEIGAKTVRVAFDADACRKRNVSDALHRLFHHLRRRGFAVELEVWGEEDGKGIDDLLAANKVPDVLTGDEAAAAVESIRAAAHAANPAPTGNGAGDDGARDGRAEVTVCMDEHITNDEAVAALARDTSLYQRAGQLVRVMRDDSPAARGIRRPYGPRIEGLPEATLRERLTAAGRWIKLVPRKDKEPKKVRVHPPKWAISAVHNRADWPNVRHLEAVIEYPALRPDGTLLLTPGYDSATGLLLEPRGELPAIPEAPTKDQAIAARNVLFEVVCDFPFQRPAHKAAWLASLLTPPARFAYAGPSPLFLVEANCRGAGKGLLLNSLCQIIKADNFTIATYTQDEDELRKRITALALAGDRLVLFDNLDGKFGNATLDAALTTTSWKDRLLGVNRVVEAPLYMTWYATGNNVAVGADTSRRICPIRLETDMERPEERKGFKFPNLLEHIHANRTRLLGAVVTILRAYSIAGRPDQGLPAWGSFEGWSALVRGAVVWVGMPDPAEARVQLQEQSDTTAEDMAVLLECWERMDPNRRGLTAGEVVGELYPKREKKDAPEPPEWYAEMRAAIDGLVERGDSRRLGNRLRHYRRRIFSGRYIDHAGSEQRAIRWAVYPASAFRPDTVVL